MVMVIFESSLPSMAPIQLPISGKRPYEAMLDGAYEEKFGKPLVVVKSVSWRGIAASGSRCLQSVSSRRSATEHGCLLGITQTCLCRDTLEQIPQSSVGDALLVDRKVAFEHTTFWTERFHHVTVERI